MSTEPIDLDAIRAHTEFRKIEASPWTTQEVAELEFLLAEVDRLRAEVDRLREYGSVHECWATDSGRCGTCGEML